MMTQVDPDATKTDTNMDKQSTTELNDTNIYKLLLALTSIVTSISEFKVAIYFMTIGSTSPNIFWFMLLGVGLICLSIIFMIFGLLVLISFIAWIKNNQCKDQSLIKWNLKCIHLHKQFLLCEPIRDAAILECGNCIIDNCIAQERKILRKKAQIMEIIFKSFELVRHMLLKYLNDLYIISHRFPSLDLSWGN
ncbi:unnamed protein product [Adineta steineri]|uniref:Uncharacterized protein n=2 Tax=Adineta steineri TaxID=433720 RepID=A0A818RQZ0_9BILA|nr:unnamed protein product [Adineta steineri]